MRILVLALQYVSGRYRWLELQTGLPQHLAVIMTYLNITALAVTQTPRQTLHRQMDLDLEWDAGSQDVFLACDLGLYRRQMHLLTFGRLILQFA